MILRRKFLKLVAGGLVVSQWPGTLLGGWGQAAPLPSEALNPRKGYFDFDETLELSVRFALLSVDGSGIQAIRQQSTNMSWFEVLPSAEDDTQNADAVAAISNLPTSNLPTGTSEAINLYLFATGTSENLPRVLALARAARTINAFTVALIIETEETVAAQWSELRAQAEIDNLCLISPAGLGPGVVSLAPELAHHQVELAYLTALRAHTDLVWDIGRIGIDYADYKAAVRGTETGRLGVGCVEECALGLLATQKALGEVVKQGVVLTQVKGCWVTIFAGSDCTMEEFDAVFEVIHGALGEDANLIIGISCGEEFAGDFIVTVLAV